ncbi:mechanosensitive ion channel protein MscL [Gigaspora margarita]|uniref:Mechanosensitive ion channel protein MscL n=1 Tax=Gigaspora margarita TaxID=4874 RepID=A0A8H3X5M0_GIGMA|nr:mechanosensitive ion channel protein MscL [Gigaspora margarita]
MCKSCVGIWKDFKDFIHTRGNVIDLGVGIIIGAAFTSVINSFVADIISPPLGLFIHGSNLENYFILIRPGRSNRTDYSTPEEAQADGAVTENVGRFLNYVINFLLVAFVLFWIIWGYNKFKSLRTKAEAEKTETCPWCLAKITLNATKCQFCTSIVNEKIPPEYKRDANASSNNNTLIDLQDS